MSEETTDNSLGWNTPEFRPDLAFPKLTDDMVERLRGYGSEETFPAGVKLFKQGARQVDMFVVLLGRLRFRSLRRMAGARSLRIIGGLIFLVS